MGLGASGALYVGVNLEFARLPLYNSVHAEQFLIANALHHGERGLRKVAVSAAVSAGFSVAGAAQGLGCGQQQGRSRAAPRQAAAMPAEMGSVGRVVRQ